MMNSLLNRSNKKLFEKLLLIIPDLEKMKDAGKSKSEGFMDFNMDFLADTEMGSRIALSHYYKHGSGDMIPDPDMEFMVNFKEKWVEPLTYQDIMRYDEVYNTDITKFKPELRESLIEFSMMWFDNLHMQGHKIDLKVPDEE